MNAKQWYLLTMTPFVAWFWFWMDIDVWQAALVGALVHMWAWTVIAPRFIGNGSSAVIRLPGGCSGRTRTDTRRPDAGNLLTMSSLPDERTGGLADFQVISHELNDDELGQHIQSGRLQRFSNLQGTSGMPSTLGAVNYASGMPMMNEWQDVRGDVFGTNSH